MRLSLFILISLFSSFAYGQHPRSDFSSKSYVLCGESEIVLKNGDRIKNQDKISGTKIGKTDINYEDVDYICLIKSSLKGYSSSNGSFYKYISIKNKPRLVKIVIESPKLSFYKERPKATGGGYNAIGLYQSPGTNSKTYMIKNADKNAQEVNFGRNFKNLAKLFPECPQLSQSRKEISQSPLNSFQMIIDIYNNDCLNISSNKSK